MADIHKTSYNSYLSLSFTKYTHSLNHYHNSKFLNPKLDAHIQKNNKK